MQNQGSLNGISTPFTPENTTNNRLNFRNRLDQNLGFNNLMINNYHHVNSGNKNFNNNSYNYPFSAEGFSYTTSFHNNGVSPLESPLHPKKPSRNENTDDLFDLGNVGRYSTMTYNDRIKGINSPLFPSKLKLEFRDSEIETRNTLERVEKDVFKLIDNDESNNYSPGGDKKAPKGAFSYKEEKKNEDGKKMLVRSMQENNTKKELIEVEEEENQLEDGENNQEYPELSDTILEQIFLSDARNSLYPQIDRKSTESINMFRDSLGFSKKKEVNRNSLDNQKGHSKDNRYSIGGVFNTNTELEKYLENEFRASGGDKLGNCFEDEGG